MIQSVLLFLQLDFYTERELSVVGLNFARVLVIQSGLSLFLSNSEKMTAVTIVTFGTSSAILVVFFSESLMAYVRSAISVVGFLIAMTMVLVLKLRYDSKFVAVVLEGFAILQKIIDSLEKGVSLISKGD